MTAITQSNQSKEKRHVFLSIAVFFASVLIVILIWNEYATTLTRFFEKELHIRSEYSSQKIRESIEENIQSLENLSDRIEFTNGEYLKYWSHDAQNILEQNPSFLFLEWIDSSMVIREIEPLKGNEPALNLDISKIEYRREEWLRHKNDSSVNVTPWSDMTQGGKAFLVDAPLYYGGQFRGTITAGMDFSEHFDDLLQGMENYAFRIEDEEGTLFYSYNEPSEQEVFEDMFYMSEYTIDTTDNQVWTLKVVPSDFASDPRTDMEGIVWLFLGVIISFLLSVLTYFFMRSVAETSRVQTFSAQLGEVNKALEQERKKEQLASRSKTDFISTMSHEIRTPLNAIIGLIEILRDDHSPERQKDYLAKMEMSSKSLLALVNDILEVDRIESGKVVFKREVFSPGEELKTICQLYKSEFEKKGLRFGLKIDERASKTVIGDSGKFNQIATNLLRNAFKFTNEGYVEVDLKALVKDQQLTLDLTVTDTGIGIPKEEQHNIFNRFSQVDSGVERKYDGSGLGLSITRQLLDLQGGSITVESEVGEGARFHVKVTYDLAAESTDEYDLDGSEQRMEFPNANVLIAEDNQMNVFILTKTLDMMKINHMTVGNGKEAIELLKEKSFDLILMDVHMPEVDGFTATTELRKMGVDTPIVALSANVTREAIDKAQAVGMNDYITKPFNRDRLLELFNKYL